MPAEWYIAPNNQQSGPHEPDALLAYGLRPETLAWRPGMPEWLPAQSIPELAPLFNNPLNNPPPTTYNPPPPGMRYVDPQQFMGVGQPPPYRPGAGDRPATGFAAIFFGWAGIHKFMLGLNQPGWITLAISFGTCGLGLIPMAILGVIEGLIYLSKTDQDFYQTYMVQRRQWF